jgi:uncharacterized membrane protein YdjX (TVP38/TMEM64 family)
MNKLNFRRIVLILLLIIAILGIIFLSEWISFEVLKENREQLSDFRDNNFALSIIIFWLLYVSITSFSLPGAAVASVSGGFLFGLGLGVIVNVTAASAGATLLFVLVRFGLKSLSDNHSNNLNTNFLSKVKNGLRYNQVSVMLILRLVPIVPFALANILPALVGARLFNFIWTTIIGIIPGGIVFTWIGVTVGEVFDRNETPDLELLFTPTILGPLLGIAALFLLPIFLRRSLSMPKIFREH